MKKQILVSGFSTFKKQMMPGEIAKRLLRNSVQKVKSFLPHFLSRPKSKVIEIGDSRPTVPSRYNSAKAKILRAEASFCPALYRRTGDE